MRPRRQTAASRATTGSGLKPIRPFSLPHCALSLEALEPLFFPAFVEGGAGSTGAIGPFFGFEAVDAFLDLLPICAMHGSPPRKGGRMSLLMFKSNNHVADTVQR